MKDYNPTNPDKIKSKGETLIDAEKLYKNRINVIKAFENEVFPFSYGFQKKKPDISDKSLQDWVKVSEKRFDTIKKM